MLGRLSIAMLAILFTFSTKCGAIVVEIRPVAEDAKLADYVACVSIDTAEKMYRAGDNCNTKYTATVIDAIKGVNDGDTLEWNLGQTDLEVSSLYIVFLAKADRFCDRKRTANCIAEGPRRRDEVCIPVVESNRIVHWGFAIFPVGHFVKEWDQSVRVSTFIELPAHIQAKPVNVEYKAATDSWVKLEDMIKYLKSLQP